MSLIKIKHYTKNTLNQDVTDQLQQLSPHTLPPYFQRYGAEYDRIGHCFTIASNQTILGFALLSTLNDMATLHALFIKKEYRGKSLGKQLTLHLLTKITQFGCQKVELESNKSQLHFFKSLGFVVVKEPCPKAKTTYFKLENPCPAYFLSAYKQIQKDKRSDKAKTSPPLVLSQDKTIYNFHDEAQFLALHRNMLSQAKRRIWITANSINASVLNDEQFRQSILQLAKNNAQAEIRILLEDGKANTGQFSPLINLVQRLTSFVEIRTLPSTAHKFTEWVTLVDFSAGIYRKTLDSYTGFATYDSSLIAQRLIAKFDDQWQFAKPSAEFRRLSI
ncbi:MAG: N-acetylglutamate synthase-like GNAT family acetyltransferase [Pseudohongiellaceae bacterium]|jgi:N-acetylglutamate synthase-like GNAT family acetyltransferase